MPMEIQEEWPGVNACLISLCRILHPRLPAVPEYCSFLSPPPCLSFLWVCYPTSCLCGLEGLWGKKEKDPSFAVSLVRDFAPSPGSF